jgi:hypothetical protein
MGVWVIKARLAQDATPGVKAFVFSVPRNSPAVADYDNTAAIYLVLGKWLTCLSGFYPDLPSGSSRFISQRTLALLPD